MLRGVFGRTNQPFYLQKTLLTLDLSFISIKIRPIFIMSLTINYQALPLFTLPPSISLIFSLYLFNQHILYLVTVFWLDINKILFRYNNPFRCYLSDICEYYFVCKNVAKTFLVYFCIKVWVNTALVKKI